MSAKALSVFVVEDEAMIRMMLTDMLEASDARFDFVVFAMVDPSGRN
jgi:CheY-like chemotaxis protein